MRGDPVGVFPDCWESVDVFCAMSTQWRVGPGGPIGLDYLALNTVMRLKQVPPARRSGVFNDLRVMESAALDEMSKDQQ